MPRLVGNICVLRPFSASDAKTSLAWRQDALTREQAMGFALPVTEAAEAAWYEDVSRDRSGRQAFFAIEDLEGNFVGHVRLADINWICKSASFGIVIGETSRRGSGIGREATRLILSYGFATLNLRRVELRVIATNAPAVNLYASLGFATEGRMREAYFAGGRYEDVLVMGLLRHEYPVQAQPSA